MKRLARALLIAAFGFVGSACASAPPPAYPAHWFAPIVDPNAPAWEILPQAAGPGEVILSKRNELGILSNFATTPFTYRGRRYASIEGFWQMMLFPEATVEGRPDPRRARPLREWGATRDEVAATTAFAAKSAGERASKILEKLGIAWVSFEGRTFPYRSAEPAEHYRIIREAMVEKLRQNPEVRRVLLATGDLVLRPDHHAEADAPPEWRYFEIWMELRAELAKP